MFTLGVCVGMVLLSAVCYRIRGSDFASNWPKWFFGLAKFDRLTKLMIGAFPAALACWLLGAPVVPCVVAWVGVMIGDSLPHAFAQGINVRTDSLADDEAKVSQVLIQGIACMILPAFVVAAVFGFHTYVYLLVLGLGAMEPLAYIVGNQLPHWPPSSGPDEYLVGAGRMVFFVILTCLPPPW